MLPFVATFAAQNQQAADRHSNVDDYIATRDLKQSLAVNIEDHRYDAIGGDIDMKWESRDRTASKTITQRSNTRPNVPTCFREGV